MNSLKDFAVYTPIGTEAVRFEGVEVVGRWQQQLEEFSGSKNRLLVEDFVNWGSEPKDIVRFTKFYAPLIAEDERPSEGNEFRFSLKSWRDIQRTFQSMWQARMGRTAASNTFGGHLPYAMSVDQNRLVLRVHSLRFFLSLELAMAPAERLRKCGRPDCSAPYFVATHLKQRYCSPNCARQAQAQWKENWWAKKGQDWLKKRKGSGRKVSKRSRKH
jgi:hypothetical protein